MDAENIISSKEETLQSSFISQTLNPVFDKLKPLIILHYILLCLILIFLVLIYKTKLR